MTAGSSNGSDERSLEKAIERLSERFWNLSTEASFESEGFAQVAVGLSAILEEAHEGGLAPGQIELLVQGLDGLADLLSASDRSEAAESDGLGQFVERFRLDAQKRLAGLSISLVGVFNDDADNDAAISQSSQHLHAIRGAAGMLGLTWIAQLSGAMEDMLLALRRQETPSSAWPVKPVLRGFAVLRGMVDDPEQEYGPVAEDLVQSLRKQIATLGKDTPNEFKRVDTSVETQALEQRILVVDDVETVAASVGFILSELDIPVDLSTDGEDALRKLRKSAYSLVISDVSMPNMGGLELVRKIRADDLLQEIPVILLTQLDRPEERARGLKAGADDYIVKGSIGGGELIARVNELLVDAPFVPAGQSEGFEQRRTILVAEDTETVAASIAFVLSEGPYDIVLAHDGQDALHKLENGVYDLVISDVEMPSMTGLELVEAVRASKTISHIPFVMLTSRDTAEDRALAMEKGADRYLVKGSVPSDELLSIVGELVGSREAE